VSAAARRRVAVIAGAGPAGLTAAWELLARTDVLPVVIEPTPATGGIAQTFTYKGNRIDIGGHRFFSKSQRVMDWWFGILPRQGAPAADDAAAARRTWFSRRRVERMRRGDRAA
jgi:protoporphyrinogen oxidase